MVPAKAFEAKEPRSASKTLTHGLCRAKRQQNHGYAYEHQTAQIYTYAKRHSKQRKTVIIMYTATMRVSGISMSSK